MSKTFVTIFPICEDVHLVKDVGQIPYFLHRLFGYNASVVSYPKSKHYRNLVTEVNGLKLELLEDNGRISFLEKAVVNYLRRNARTIDVLNLYHYTKQSFAYGLLYKRLNPQGKLFLKVDGYNDTFKSGNKVRHSVKPVKNFLLGKLERACLDRTDLISIENTEGEQLMRAMFPEYAKKIIYLPVGVNDLFLKEHFGSKLKEATQKENIILTTGRIGLDIKNHEMILKALCKVELKDWKMVFVGPFYSNIQDLFERMTVEFPHLKGKVVFTGELSNREELYEWYNRSKIFLMTSHRESFSVAIAEAIYFGNYVIGTEGVMSMKDVTDNGRLGKIIKDNDVGALSAELQKRIDDPSSLGSLMPEIMSRSRERFVWTGIIKQLHDALSK